MRLNAQVVQKNHPNVLSEFSCSQRLFSLHNLHSNEHLLLANKCEDKFSIISVTVKCYHHFKYALEVYLSTSYILVCTDTLFSTDSCKDSIHKVVVP